MHRARCQTPDSFYVKQKRLKLTAIASANYICTPAPVAECYRTV